MEETQVTRESTQTREDEDGEMERQNIDRHEYSQKMIRTDAYPFPFPFRTTSSPIANVHHLPPLHPSSGTINVGTINEPIANFFYNPNGNSGCSTYDSPPISPSIYDVDGGALGPRMPSFKSQAVAMGFEMGGGLNHHQHCYSVFTPLQWQELKRQALIYKHIVSSSPIPPDLLVETTYCKGALPSVPPLYPNLGRNGVAGGGYFNLRFTNNTDPEPGRCRRTDGKKWRCSKDVAPDQKYCERHLHRGRPRSRKPVGQQRRKNTAPVADSETTVKSNTTCTTTSIKKTTLSDAVLPHANIGSSETLGYGQTSSRSLPFSPIESDKEPRYLDWMIGGLAEIHSNTKLNNNISPNLPTDAAASSCSSLHQYEEQLKLNYSSEINDACNSLFLNNDYSSHSDGNQEQDHGRHPLRSFINAWSNEKTSVGRNMASTSPSNLTLSMANHNNTEESSINNIQMGLGISNNIGCGRSNSLSWMNPISTPLGGPLAEALQSTSSPRNSSEEVDGVMGNSKSNNGGLVNLLGWSCCESPKKSSPPRMIVSSPTGVLQRTLVSLSDSSSNSSPTFQWMNSHTK